MALTLVALLGALVARAPVDAATGFDLTLVRPSASGSAYVRQESAALATARTWAWGINFNGVFDPLILREPTSNQREGGLLERRLETTMGLAYSPTDRVTLALSLLAIPWQSGSGGMVPLASAETSPSHIALGDTSLMVKVGLWGKGQEPGLRLTFSGELFAPTGQTASYAGGGGVTAFLRLWGGYLGERATVSLGGGYDLVPRADVPLVGILVDDRWTLAAAGSWRLTPKAILLAELQASVLVETARRLYPRGISNALGQAPAYALLGARLDVLPLGQLLVGAWTGLDAQPGAAKLGLLAGWSGTWEVAGRRPGTKPEPSAEPPSRPLPPDTERVATSERAEPTTPERRPAEGETRSSLTDDEAKAIADRRSNEAKAAGDKPAVGETTACPSGRCGESTEGALARLEGDEIILAEPLPFQGRTAKLAASSIPTLKAIAKILKAQRGDVRLALGVEAVGSRPADAKLADKRAKALKGVFVHLAHWPAKRISTEGTPSRGGSSNVTTPSVRLVLVGLKTKKTERTDSGPTREVTPPEPPKPIADEPIAPSSETKSVEPASPTVSAGGPVSREGDLLVLAEPLPFQGRTAKLAATSIPLLKAIAKELKQQPSKTILVLTVEAVGARPADLALAEKRAEALQDVFAHLARWSPKRIVGSGSASRGTSTDVTRPAIRFELAASGAVPPKEPSEEKAAASDAREEPETTTPEPSGKPAPEGGALARLEGNEILLDGPLPFQGDSAKLAAASVPKVKAIGKLLKSQKEGTVLTLRLEAVGSSADDLELAQNRARALKTVFAKLAHWPETRIVAVGIAPTGKADEVALPPVTLQLGTGRGPEKATRPPRKR